MRHYIGIDLSIAIIIVVVASLCFCNSYDGAFVFDDCEAIVKNKDVQHSSLLDIFKNDFWGTRISHDKSHKSYRPLTILTFRLHYWLRGYLESRDFHVFNIILHVCVSFLTLFVYHVILGSDAKDTAFYATLLFAVHPVHTEAVAGVVGRADMLCALFMWISILLYHGSIYAKTSCVKWVSLGACIFCDAIAMLCKETGLTAIGICAVYDVAVVNNIMPSTVIDFLKSNGVSLKDNKFLITRYKNFVLRLVVLSIAAFGLLLLRFSIMGFSAPLFQPGDNPASFSQELIIRVLNYNYIYSLNAWLMLCPDWLCFDWAMGCIPLISGLDRRIFAIVIFWYFMGLFFLYILRHDSIKESKQVIMGFAFLIIPFLPATNIFFTVGFVIAERTLYIPSAGYCLLIAIGFEKLYKQHRCNLLLGTYFVLIGVFFMRSWLRSDQWRNERTLFQSALGVCPLNAKVHYNIAKTAADMGNVTYAEQEYNVAIRLHPNYSQAMNNLGNLFKDQHKYTQAKNLFEKAVELQTDFAAAWMNLGIVLAALKNPRESERSYLTALSHRSMYPDCFYNLGVLYLEQKDYKKALMAWGNATKQKPDHKRAWINTILLLDDLGRTDEALAMGNKALVHLPEEASIFFNIANILGKAGKFEDAEKQFDNAITRDTNNPTFYTNLGVLYHRWQKYEKAQQMYKKALMIDPNLKSAKVNLRNLKRSLQKLDVM